MTEIMDDAIDDLPRSGRERGDIDRAASNSRCSVYTPSVLHAAAEALYEVRNALTRHEIASAMQFQAFGDSFAGQVLHACEDRFSAEHPDLETDVDPVALLHTAVEAAATHLGHPLEPAEGPALAPTGRAVFGYVMLPRLTESPPWGAEGDAPLVLSLGREDLHMLRIAYSSGSGFDGPYEPGPWRWYLGHRVPHNTCISETRVIAPALTSEVAVEVGVLTAEVLTGQVPLPR